MCRAGNSAYRRHWARQRARPDGDPVRLVSAAGARRELQRLREAGAGTRTIAEQSGLSRSTVTDLLAGRSATVAPDTLDALTSLAVRPARVPSGRVTAALEALRVAGFSTGEVAVMAGLDGRRLRVRHGRVDRATADGVLDVFERCGGRLDREGRVAVTPIGPSDLTRLRTRHVVARLVTAA